MKLLFLFCFSVCFSPPYSSVSAEQWSSVAAVLLITSVSTIVVRTRNCVRESGWGVTALLGFMLFTCVVYTVRSANPSALLTKALNPQYSHKNQ